MRVAFITGSASRLAGGIFEIERRLAQSLGELPDTCVDVFGLQDQHSQKDRQLWAPLQPKIFKHIGPASFCYSSGLRNAFLNCQADIGHLHLLWTYCSVLMHKWSARTRRPYLVTANGMLEPWAVNNSRVKKRVALLLYERQCLKDCSCIQVNSESECGSVRAFGLKNPVCVIPNGIDLPELVDGGESVVDSPLLALKADGRKVLLYLGRIHPKKGLVNLLKAWRQTLNSQPSTLNPWVLAIAGWEEGGHEAELKQLATELGIQWTDARDAQTTGLQAYGTARQVPVVENRCSVPPSSCGPLSCGPWSVVFLGPQFGEDKAACYRECDAFILPSLSEGLPMVVLEAWSYGKLVLMTPECNLPEGFAASAALRIETNVESIVAGLQGLFSLAAASRAALGQNGYALVTERFTWPKVASEMKAVYEWVLGSGSKPSCVV